MAFAKKVKDIYSVARRRMVEEQLREITDQRVREVMANLPRHRFVQPGMEDQAYLDRPLHIGNGQTISQPLMVGLMTEKLELTGSEKVLEIGTGSGYQTAILAELAGEVFTIERIRELMLFAQKNLHRIGYKNIKFRVGDGTKGWPENAPYDAIIVTAGAPIIPESLADQLVEGGRLIIPIGSETVQELLLLRKIGGNISQNFVTRCRFVKLIGEDGWKLD